MNIIQQKILNVTLNTLPFSLPLAEQVIYSHLVEKYRTHWLVRLEEALDLGWKILSDCFEPAETGMKESLVKEFWPKAAV